MAASFAVSRPSRPIRSHSQPATPVEELALLVGHILPLTRRVVQHTTVQRDILAAGNDLQRIELQIFHRSDRVLDPFNTAPTASGPQPLPAEDEPPRHIPINRKHNDLTLELLS